MANTLLCSSFRFRFLLVFQREMLVYWVGMGEGYQGVPCLLTSAVLKGGGLGAAARADHPVVRRVGQISWFWTVLSTTISSELQ